jgi:hypothetical protein
VPLTVVAFTGIAFAFTSMGSWYQNVTPAQRDYALWAPEEDPVSGAAKGREAIGIEAAVQTIQARYPERAIAGIAPPYDETGTVTARRLARSPLPPALWASAVRCTTVYVVVPLAGPLIGMGRRPPFLLAIALTLPGVLLSARSMAISYRAERDGALLVAAALCALNVLALVVHVLP